MTSIIDKAYKSGSKQVLFVGKALGHKPTISGVAREKSGRKGRHCLYPCPDARGQANFFLSSHHPLLLVWKILVLNQLWH